MRYGKFQLAYLFAPATLKQINLRKSETSTYPEPTIDNHSQESRGETTAEPLPPSDDYSAHASPTPTAAELPEARPLSPHVRTDTPAPPYEPTAPEPIRGPDVSDSSNRAQSSSGAPSGTIPGADTIDHPPSTVDNSTFILSTSGSDTIDLPPFSAGNSVIWPEKYDAGKVEVAYSPPAG